MSSNDTMIKVLMVCVGNSCRSPMAESVLRHFSETLDTEGVQWHIDSAAIADWNVGRSPEPRAIAVLSHNGLTSNHITRQITKDDFREFDFIFGMDNYNMEDLFRIEPADGTANIEMLGTYDFGQPEVIVDPYFDQGIFGFERAYEKIYRSCRNFFLDKDRHISTTAKSEL